MQTGLARSRAQAREMIELGQVAVLSSDGQRLPTRASTLVQPHTDLAVQQPDNRYVSRGAHKLRHALDEFAINPQGLICLDAGQSTGGFTDCLLQAGAARVVGVDVGHDQLRDSLRQDPRVICLEHMNLRHQNRQSVANACQMADPDLAEHINRQGFALIVADLSFISLALILPALAGMLAADGQIIALVKPQFELGPGAVNKHGVVTDQTELAGMQSRMQSLTKNFDLQMLGWTDSPIAGGSGNHEFLMHLRGQE